MLRLVLILLFASLLSGCSGALDIFLSVPAKVNKAFPVNAEVRRAADNLRELLSDEQRTSKSFERQYASRLELRALSCIQGVSIGLFDTVKTVKALPLSRDCFSAQDAQLLTFLGIRQVGVRISQPPLRPIAPLGQPLVVPALAGLEVYSGYAAAGAGVAVLRGTRGEFVSIQIPGGKKIVSLPNTPEASHLVSLSPNGRVVAIPIRSSSVLFVDTETGEKLFESSDINQLLSWLPDTSSILVTESKKNHLAVIDLKSGSISPHNIPLRNQSWSIPLSTSPTRVIVGSQRTFSIIENVRSNEGIQGEVVKEFSTKIGSGVTSSPPTLMLGGKAIVFISGRDFMMVNLESGQETLWKTGEFLANWYGKLSETKLLVDSYDAIGGVSSKPWVFDVEQATLSPVQTEKARSGIIYELSGRLGFMRRDSQIWFGGELETGAPESLDGLLGKFNLDRQIANLEAMTRPNEIAGSGGSQYAIANTLSSAPNAARPSGPIAELARNSLVEAVGVYQGGGGANRATTDGRKMGYVEVRIRRSTKPVVLILSSYEPVRWMLISEPGAKLSTVLVSGYHPSEVIGSGLARVVVIGSNYAYKLDSKEYGALNTDVIRRTGKGIDVFQGGYEGRAFSVGG